MKQWIYGLMIVLVAIACNDDLSIEHSIVGDKEVCVAMNFGAVEHGKVEVNSRTTYDLHYESMVRNLYVYLFTADGERLYGRYFGDEEKNKTLLVEHWMINNMSSDGTIAKTQGSVQMKVPTVTNAEIVMIANIDLDFLNLSEERLGLVRDKQDLQQMILTLNQERPERNAGYFMMTGSLSGINIAENGTVSMPENVQAIQLKRLDAKVEVNVRVNPKEESSNQKVEEFIPESWQVVNLPKSCYLLPNQEDPTQGQDAYFRLEPMNFETTENEVVNGQETGGVLNGFSFYMLENRETMKKTVGGNKALRDMRIKHTDDVHSDDYGTYNTAEGMWEYAPEYGTYVIIKGELKMVVNPGETTEQRLTADVTYHVHLGDFDTNKDDYTIERNTHYKYTLTIKGVKNIELEVETSTDNLAGITENQPGASGHLYTAEEDIYTFDAHYGQRVYHLYAKDIDVENMTWYVKTPMGRDGVPEKDPMSGQETYEYMDYEWVEFMLNEKSANLYSEANQPYPADKTKLMNVIQFVNLLKKETVLWRNNQDNIFDKEGKINVTVFVNEYYYDKNPKNPNDTDLLWKKFVNQPPRLMHILCKSEYSKDGDSSDTGSILTIRQRSIQTPFNISPAKTELKQAWGCETVDEMKNQAWFYHPDEPKMPGDGDEDYKDYQYIPKGYTAQNTSKTNGLYNTACLLNLVGNGELKWNTFLDYTKRELELESEYKAGLYSVFLRNRDLNGDNKVDPEELRWYIASLDQLCGLFLGDQGLHGDAQLYPIAASREPNIPVNDGSVFNGIYPWRLHVVSSTAWKYTPGNVPVVVWAEEGASTGQYQSHWTKKAGYSPIRCVRNLGMADANKDNIANPEANYPENSLVNVIEPSSSSTAYKFDFTNMNEQSRRYYTTRELAPGDEYSVMSRLYDGFETGSLFKYTTETYSYVPLKYELENGGTPTSVNGSYAGYRVPNVREGVVMYLYCSDSEWWNNNVGTMVSNYYSFGEYGNGYDDGFYSWSIFHDRVTVGNNPSQYIRLVKDWNPN